MQQHVVEVEGRSSCSVQVQLELVGVAAVDDAIEELARADIAHLHSAGNVLEVVGDNEGRGIADLPVPEVADGHVVQVVLATAGERNTVLPGVADQQVVRGDAVVAAEDPGGRAVQDLHVVEHQLVHARGFVHGERPCFALDPDQAVADLHVPEHVVLIGEVAFIDPDPVPLAGQLVVQALQAISLESDGIADFPKGLDPSAAIHPQPATAMEVHFYAGLYLQLVAGVHDCVAIDHMRLVVGPHFHDTADLVAAAIEAAHDVTERRKAVDELVGVVEVRVLSPCQ